MITIYKDRIIRIEWTILKGTSNVKEDFTRSLLKMFLIGPHDRYLMDGITVDGVIHLEIPQGMPEGAYSIEAVWVKNGGMLKDPRFNDRCIMRSRKDYLFAITEYESEATNIGEGEVVIRVRSSVATYGYDGLSAYEIATFRNEYHGSEKDFVKLRGNIVDTILSDKSPYPLENRVIAGKFKEVDGHVDELKEDVGNVKEEMQTFTEKVVEPDEEDITVEQLEEGKFLKLKDRTFNLENFSGMGRKILRKNIISDCKKSLKNILVQEMINQPYTIYVVQYDFDLNGATITLPEGCMFDFQGGSISNGFLEGKIENTHARPEWFHSPKDEDWSAAIQQALNVCPTVKLSDKIYNISKKIVLNIYNSLIGCGHARSIILSQIDDGYAIYCNLDDDFNPLSTPYATMQIKDLDIRYKYSGWQETEYLEYYPNAHAIVSDGYINIENVFISHFNKIIVFPVYADNVRLYNIRADDRARLKNPQYDAHKDFNVKWESNGDNTVIDNCYNMNFYFSNNPNITFRNGIQCGVYLYYANAFVFGLHNEDTVHYKIKLQDSTSTFIKCYFHRNPLNVDEKSIFTFKRESSSNFLIIQDCVFNNHGYVKEQVYIQEPTCIYVEKKNADVRIINSYVSVSSNHGDIYYKQNVFIKEKDTIYEIPSMNGRYYNGIVCVLSITNKLSYYFYENNISLIPAKRIYFTYNNTLRIGDYKYELYEVLDKVRKIITKRSHSYSINRLENDKVIRLYLFSTIYSNSTAMLRRTFNSDERHKIYLPLLACGTAILIDDGETIVGNPTKWEIDDEDEKYNIIDEQSPVGFIYQNNGMNVTVLLKEIPTEGQWVAGDSAYVKGHKYQYDGTNWLDKNGIIANTRKQGNSENRPTNVPAGFYYFDTSLNKPVWKKNDDTNEWVDASGVTV